MDTFPPTTDFLFDDTYNQKTNIFQSFFSEKLDMPGI